MKWESFLAWIVNYSIFFFLSFQHSCNLYLNGKYVYVHVQCIRQGQIIIIKTYDITRNNISFSSTSQFMYTMMDSFSFILSSILLLWNVDKI